MAVIEHTFSSKLAAYGFRQGLYSAGHATPLGDPFWDKRLGRWVVEVEERGTHLGQRVHYNIEEDLDAT